MDRMEHRLDTGRGDARRYVGLFFVALTLLGLVTMVHLLVVYNERGFPLSWREAFLSGLATWYPWGVLAPLIFWVCRRFPMEPGTWKRSLGAHVPAALVFISLYNFIRWGLSYIPWIDEKPIPWRMLMLGQFFLTFLSYIALVSVYQAWRNYRRFQERQLRMSQLETQLARAELQALKMQLQPHFLFNTLNAISTLVHRDPDKADEMITQLSELLRMTLDHGGAQEVTLEEELDFLQRYLDIQQMRFQDRLTVRLDVPTASLDARVPNQILQPIVENAIKHGLDARPGGGLIEIMGVRENGHLTLTVRDDGPGLQDTPAREGVGLGNTRARLRSLYGRAGGLELRNHRDGGLQVVLTIPQRPGADGLGAFVQDEALS